MFKNTHRILSIYILNARHAYLNYHVKIRRTPKQPTSGDVFSKQAKLFQKLMSQKPQEKKKKYVADSQSHESIPTSNFNNASNQKVRRRQYILESLFMNHITDMLANEEIGGSLNNYSLEITNVKVSSNYSTINVWWHTRDSDNLQIIAKILNENAPKIRAILTSRNIIGNIPQIQFVLDREASKLAELENALSKADFGPDFVREITTTPAFIMPIQEQSLESLVNKRFKDLKTSVELPNRKEVYNIPANMKQDILGLDHHQMMDTVFQKKTRKPSVLKSNDKIQREAMRETRDDILVYQNLDIKQFIKNRKALQKSESRKSIIDKEMSNFVREELEERQNNYDEFDANDYEDDYLDDSELK